MKWEGIKVLSRTLEGQAKSTEQRFLHAITHRQKNLQGLNDLVDSPLRAKRVANSRKR